MKTLFCLMIIGVVLATCVGCISYRVSVYGASCINVGAQRIYVPGFKLCQSRRFSEVVSGELLPKQRKWSGPYSGKPNQNVVIVWKELTTGEEVCKAVKVILPAHNQWGRVTSTIIFYIDPDNKEVRTSYDLFDAATGVRETIDDEGRGVDLETGKTLTIKL